MDPTKGDVFLDPGMPNGYPAARPVSGRLRPQITKKTRQRFVILLPIIMLLLALGWFWRLQPLALHIDGYGPVGESVGMDRAIEYRRDGEAQWYFTIENGGPLPVTLTGVSLRDDPLIRLKDVLYETKDLSLRRPLDQIRLGSGDEVRLMVRARLSKCPLDRTPDRGTTGTTFGFDVPVHILRYETLGVSRTSTVAELHLSVAAPARFLCFELYG